MAACKIDRGSAFNCAALVQPGIGDYAILVNHDDLANGAITVDGTSKEIDSITLDTGTYGYKAESSKGSAQIIPSSPLRAVSAIDGFDHSVEIRILDVSQLSVENISKMRFQKVSVLIPLASNAGALLYGRNVGMRISEFDYLPGDADTGGTLRIVLKTPDNDPPEIAAPIRIDPGFDITSILQA